VLIHKVSELFTYIKTTPLLDMNDTLRVLYLHHWKNGLSIKCGCLYSRKEKTFEIDAA